MKITFIRPHLSNCRSTGAMEPLVFALLAGMTPRDVEVELFDERIEPVPLDRQTDLVAITVETATSRRAYQIAGYYRRMGVPVIMGGYHTSFVPDESLAYCDSVLLGDAEGLWPLVVEDARHRRLRRVYSQADQPSLESLHYDRSIFYGKRYGPIVPVQYGRGCRYACDFCSIHAMYGSRMRQRPVREVVSEIESIGRRNIMIVDDNIFADAPKATELFEALVPLRIRWLCQVTSDVARNPALLDLMAKSGCIAALVGFESLDAGSLADMRKKWNADGVPSADYSNAIQAFYDRGIMLIGSFVFGYDHDTPDIFERTVEFAIRSKFALANFNTLAPTPGSRLYDRLRAEGRLLMDPWWLDPRYRYGEAAFRPARMTETQLRDGCNWARRTFYGVGSILRRSLTRTVIGHGPVRLGLYGAANLGTRREFARKLGARLGADEPLPGESDPQRESHTLRNLPLEVLQ